MTHKYLTVIMKVSNWDVDIIIFPFFYTMFQLKLNVVNNIYKHIKVYKCWFTKMLLFAVTELKTKSTSRSIVQILVIVTLKTLKW